MKSKFFAKIFGLVCMMLAAVTFNAAAGATLAVAVGCAPGAGAVAGNVLALVGAVSPLPECFAPECSQKYGPAR